MERMEWCEGKYSENGVCDTVVQYPPTVMLESREATFTFNPALLSKLPPLLAIGWKQLIVIIGIVVKAEHQFRPIFLRVCLSRRGIITKRTSA